jgi:flagellar hook protein FlgE
MMRSMFSGVSGLRSHQTRMDVIGNNIANVNTVGFKSGRVTFQEVFNQTLRGAGSPDATTGRGGTNPMQIGLGLGVGSIDTIITRGSSQRTDNPTDLSIDGDGFFIVKGGNADMFRFTRAGNFGIDKLGNLVSGSGMNVYGWQQYVTNSDGSVEFNTEAELEPINLYSDDYNLNKRMIAAKATANAVFTGNLDARKAKVTTSTALNEIGTAPSTPHFKVPTMVYDSMGNSYEVSINFSKCYVDATDPDNPVTSWYWEIGDPANMSSQVGGSTASGYIVFDKDGKIIDNSDPDNSDYSSYNIKPTVSFIPNAAVTGTDPFDVQFDFTKMTMYAADSSVNPSSIDGYPTGNLVTFSIGSDGILTGVYSNGQQQPLGMLALASFDNPGGLQKVGDNMFTQTTNSGEFTGKGIKAGTEGVGTLSPGTLEMSNVDLSKEFTEMIITQRGFQANSRIITASDEMLQELVNLKR